MQEWSDGVLQRSFVLDLLLALIAAVRVFFRSRTDTSLEVLALRQQVSVLKPETSTTDSEPLRSPVLDHASESVVSMDGCSGHRQAGNSPRLASRRLSPLLALAVPPRGRRPKVTGEIKDLIRRVSTENAGWGAPKIHGEL